MIPGLDGSEGANLGGGELSLLAIIQGLTEFLPVSSSGHLAIAGHLLEEDGTPLWVEVALHVGTLAAVLVVYRSAVADILRGFFGGRPREALLVGLGTLPVVVVGFLFKDRIEAATADEHFVGYGLLGTTVMLTIGEWARRRNLRNSENDADLAPALDSPGPKSSGLTVRTALVVGLLQCVAILPGVSRSGTTIAAGLLCGLGPAQAARFSFLLSIPAILGACILTAKDADASVLGEGGFGAILWAMALAGFVGWAALRVLIAFLGRGAFGWFAVYCALLAVGVFAFL